MESDDQEKLARLLKADPDSRLKCKLETVFRTYEGLPEKAVWMAPHAPGRTHIFAFGMYSYHPAIRGLGKRRVFEIYFSGEVGEGLEPLYLNDVYGRAGTGRNRSSMGRAPLLLHVGPDHGTLRRPGVADVYENGIPEGAWKDI